MWNAVGRSKQASLGLLGFKSWLSYSPMEQLLSLLSLGFSIRRKEMVPYHAEGL